MVISIETLLKSIFDDEEIEFIKRWIAQIKREMYIEQKELIENSPNNFIICKYHHPPINLLLTNREGIIGQEIPYIDPQDSSISITCKITEGPLHTIERYITFNTKTIQLH